MRSKMAGGLLLLTLMALSAWPAEAQVYKSSVGWNAGALITTSLNEGAAGGSGFVELKPDPTWTIGAYYDRWYFGGQIGLRGHGSLARHVLPWNQGDREIYMYAGDLSLMLRPLRPTLERTVAPFLSGGVGFQHWGLGDGPVTSFAPAEATYPGDEKFYLMAVGGLGFDIVTPINWGEGPLVVRLEGRDQIQIKSPFEPLDAEQSDFSLIHNIRVSIGFHTGVGLLGGSR